MLKNFVFLRSVSFKFKLSFRFAVSFELNLGIQCVSNWTKHVWSCLNTQVVRQLISPRWLYFEQTYYFQYSLLNFIPWYFLPDTILRTIWVVSLLISYPARKKIFPETSNVYWKSKSHLQQADSRFSVRYFSAHWYFLKFCKA